MDHGSPDPGQNIPAVRASDAERHETARILQEAFSEGRLTVAEFDERTSQAYGARFRTELVQLTVDLVPARRADTRPDLHTDPTGDRPAQASQAHSIGAGGDRTPVRRVTGEPGTGTSIAVMSGCDRKGIWTIAGEHTAVAVMGGISIDLREAGLQSGAITIRAFAVWGGIEILVPDDLHLVVDGVGLMGGIGVRRVPRPENQPGLPRRSS